MTLPTLIQAIRERLEYDDAGHWTMDASEIEKLLAIVEFQRAALEWYADCDEERTSEYAIAGLDKVARQALQACDKLAGDE